MAPRIWQISFRLLVLSVLFAVSPGLAAVVIIAVWAPASIRRRRVRGLVAAARAQEAHSRAELAAIQAGRRRGW